MTNYERIIILCGPPGAGKGTLSRIFMRQHDYVRHVSTGELVRGIRSEEIGSAYTKVVHDAFIKDELMPDDIFAEITLEAINKQREANFDVGLTFLDGFPQKQGDWEHFSRHLHAFRMKVIGIIELWASESTCVERMVLRGMRKGEVPNPKYESLESYYVERYKQYVENYRIIRQILLECKLPMAVIDVNENTTHCDTHYRASEKFCRAVQFLLDTADRRENEDD